MRTTNRINEALEIMLAHDWFYPMADSGYIAKREAAKTSMREFVAIVNRINNESVREALRNLWIAKYNASKDMMEGRSGEWYASRRDELMNVILHR